MISALNAGAEGGDEVADGDHVRSRMREVPAKVFQAADCPLAFTSTT